MNILGIGGGNANPIDAETNLIITPLGTDKSDSPETPENTWRVLQNLKESGGPCTPREIAASTGMDMKTVRAVARNLLAKKYIRVATTTE